MNSCSIGLLTTYTCLFFLYILQIERYISVGLVGLLPAAAVMPCEAIDMAIAVALPLHNHMGMEVVIMDYVKPDIVMNAAKVANWVLGVATTAGLVYFNLNDVGISKGIAQLWAL
eukprot:m.67987 g.67987  ORF g.67987 m.67987 type:complete len:115 (+) comp15975_c0_seq1:352-696(+)